MLGTCLALVKPVGMSDSDAETWLRVATREVVHLPPDILAECCQVARRTCTHHGQIVPAILKTGEDWLASRRKLVCAGEPIAPAPCLPSPAPWVPDDTELAAIKQKTAERLRAER